MPPVPADATRRGQVAHAGGNFPNPMRSRGSHRTRTDTSGASRKGPAFDEPRTRSGVTGRTHSLCCRDTSMARRLLIFSVERCGQVTAASRQKLPDVSVIDRAWTFPERLDAESRSWHTASAGELFSSEGTSRKARPLEHFPCPATASRALAFHAPALTPSGLFASVRPRRHPGSSHSIPPAPLEATPRPLRAWAAIGNGRGSAREHAANDSDLRRNEPGGRRRIERLLRARIVRERLAIIQEVRE
jgi:hypothetical protein